MISITTAVEWRGAEMREALANASERSQRQTAYQIMQDAQESIKTSDQPSLPGQPPHTRGRSGKTLRAIQYDATKDDAMIGPLASAVGDIGAAHEFGETFRGTDYDERPFMGPALQRNIDAFAQAWNGSFGD